MESLWKLCKTLLSSQNSTTSFSPSYGTSQIHYSKHFWSNAIQLSTCQCLRKTTRSSRFGSFLCLFGVTHLIEQREWEGNENSSWRMRDEKHSGSLAAVSTEEMTGGVTKQWRWAMQKNSGGELCRYREGFGEGRRTSWSVMWPREQPVWTAAAFPPRSAGYQFRFYPHLQKYLISLIHEPSWGSEMQTLFPFPTSSLGWSFLKIC